MSGCSVIRQTRSFRGRYHYMWWNEDSGWRRDRLDALPIANAKVPALLRQLKMLGWSSPGVVSTIAIPIGR